METPILGSQNLDGPIHQDGGNPWVLITAALANLLYQVSWTGQAASFWILFYIGIRSIRYVTTNVAICSMVWNVVCLLLSLLLLLMLMLVMIIMVVVSVALVLVLLPLLLLVFWLWLCCSTIQYSGIWAQHQTIVIEPHVISRSLHSVCL